MAVYFLVWAFLLPFVASLTWLTIDRLRGTASSFGLSFGDALFAAPFGVVFCLVITIPLSIIIFILSKIVPTLFARRRSAAVLVGILTVVGALWALFVVRDSGFTGTAFRTLLVGGLAGLCAGLSSVLLLRRPPAAEGVF
ncbi:MAG TPA: hypothetical protein VN673_06040 [Clostridia bacterium]|nr:hypothetical protein [Clostridia bacterium]